MTDKMRTLLVISLALMLGALAIGVLENVSSLIQTDRTIGNVGSVKGVGVGIYWDSACTNQVNSINWGVIDPGSNKTIAIYVRNEGNAAVTLTKTTQNWTPTTSETYMTLNWNYAGQTLSVKQVLLIKMTLIVSPKTSGITSFAFDIIITASG